MASKINTFFIFTKLCSKSWHLHPHYNTKNLHIVKTQHSRKPFTKRLLRLICVPVGSCVGFCRIRAPQRQQHEYESIYFSRLDLEKYEVFLKNKDREATCESSQFTPNIPGRAGLCENCGLNLKLNVIHCDRWWWKQPRPSTRTSLGLCKFDV